MQTNTWRADEENRARPRTDSPPWGATRSGSTANLRVGLLTGRRVRGSWWADASARTIFAVLQQLNTHPEVTFTKLLGRKDTYVHARLWPALLTVGSEGAGWQLADIPPRSLDLLQQLEQNNETEASGPAARELLVRLLVHGHQGHSAQGHHQHQLETWSRWAKRTGCECLPTPGQGYRALEGATIAYGAPLSMLEWQRPTLRIRDL